MRRVVAAEYVTVDGVMTDPGGVGEIERGGWSNQYFNDELAKYQSDQLFASDALPGDGKHLFREGTDKHNLALIDAKATSTGVALLTYQPAAEPSHAAGR